VDIDIEERWKNRVDANAVGKILQAIAVTPNRTGPEPATSAVTSTSGLMAVRRK
jgi:hypothetical protein